MCVFVLCLGLFVIFCGVNDLGVSGVGPGGRDMELVLLIRFWGVLEVVAVFFGGFCLCWFVWYVVLRLWCAWMWRIVTSWSCIRYKDPFLKSLGGIRIVLEFLEAELQKVA